MRPRISIRGCVGALHYGMNAAQIVLYPQNFTITDLAKNHRLHSLASLVNVCTTFGAIEPIYWLSETLKVTVVREFVEKQKICTSFSKLCQLYQIFTFEPIIPSFL